MVGAAVLRYWHVYALRDLPLFDRLIVDSEVYDSWAQRIAAGDWLGATSSRAFFMDPLYPYLLASIYKLAGRDLLVVRLVQAVLGVATCGLVALIGRRLRDAAAGNLAALLMALYGAAIFQDGEFEKTALGVFLAAASLAMFLSHSLGSRFVSGVAVSLAALTRGNLLLLAPVAATYLLATRQWRAAFVFLLGASMALAPVAWRNHHVSGEWVLTTSAMGQNFYTGNNPGNPRGNYRYVPFVRPQPEHEEADFLREAERRVGRPLTATEASAFWFRAGLNHIAASPDFSFVAIANRLGLFWSDAEAPDGWDFRFIRRYSPALRVAVVSFAVLAGLALLGAFSAYRTSSGRIVIAYVLLYCGSLAPFIVFSRYRLHVAPALAALAGSGILWSADRIKQGKHKTLAVPVCLGIALMVLSALSFPSQRGEAISNYASLAEIYQERDDFPRARALLDEAARKAPGDPSILYALGALNLRSGNIPVGLSYAIRCLEADPTFPDAWYLLGLAWEASGRMDRAQEAYRRQLEVIPGHGPAQSRLR